MDKYYQLMDIYNANCDKYKISAFDISNKDTDFDDDNNISLTISGTLSKLFKTYIFLCSYYPDGYGKADVNINVMEKGKGYVLQKKIKVEDTIEY